jgi:hypothetical protein
MPKKSPKSIIQFFSNSTGKFYQLIPTKTLPALRINAVPMHKFAKLDPLEDVKRKISVLRPHGRILDTCMGLGYTAIYSAKLNEVKQVTTIEKDQEVIKICKFNHASSNLFVNSKIKIIEGDVSEIVSGFHDNFFDCIIHDPPTYVVAPELYSKNFYLELFRVLKFGGRLWHYAAMPGKSSGKSSSLPNKIISGLESVGFVGIEHDLYSDGIICSKPSGIKNF